RAAIGSVGGTAASMTISTNFNWDYNPANGVPGSAFDFQSTFIHEVGHALGFTSGADGSNFMEILDIYRFQRTDGTGDYNPDDEAEFQVRPRLVDNNSPNDDHNTNLFLPDGTDVEYRMADGNPDQASHWRDGFPAIGIMDPTGAPGETFYPDFYQTSDLRALDAIGWDWAPENGITAIPFFDGFNGASIDTALWSGNDGAAVNGSSISPPSAPNALNLNFNDELRSALMDTSGVETVRVSYWWQSGGNLPVPEANEDLVVDYRNSSGAWVELARYAGGQGSTPFAFASHDLTGADDALHAGFRIRMRCEATGTADNWFVDDISIIGINPPSNDGCFTPVHLFAGASPFDSANATTEGNSELCGDFESDIWFFYVADCDGEATISVCDATYDTQLAIYGAACPNMPNLASVCNDDTCGTGATVTYPVTAGQFNRIRLGSATGATGTGTIMISCGPVGAAPCPWDCTPMGGNGVVNIDDLLEVINNFGPGSTCDSAPDNGDGTFGNGVVNIDDLLATINHFGACPN
ncbi:MAG: NF038122 family metalloprotease, partial [Phycisphaerales bacterium]|nr:NF038122 family metalloprotease [Phycisphaerales bacterium]